MVQPQDRAAARAAREKADPFGQLDQAIAQHEDGGQIALGFEGEERVLPLVRDLAYNFIQSQIKQIRAFAAMRDEELLFENLCCEHCGFKDVFREIEDGHWFWKCRDCAKPVSDIAALRQLKKLFDDLRAASSNHPSQDKAAGIEVFSFKDIHHITDNIGTLSSDEHSKARFKSTLARLIEIGTIRPYVVPNPAWRGQLDELRDSFPNFVDAIDEAVEPSFAIAAAGGRCRPAPILLVGPPGVGKTFFASVLASVLQTPTFKVDMSSATAGSTLDGLAVHWGNAAPGEVFKTLAFGRAGVIATAGPVGFIDEIDKAGANLRYDPLGGLYSLLEVESSKNFEDQSLPGIRIDASHVRWIAAANELDTIPKPIQSRFHIVHVPAPTGPETERMFGKIFAGVVKDTGLYDFGNQISRAVISHAVEKYSAREFKTRAVMAIGKALARNRHYVEGEDFGTAPAPTARKMGF